MDAVSEFNLLPHSTTGVTPHSPWNPTHTPIPPLLPLDKIVTTPIRTTRSKLQSRALTYRYMYVIKMIQIISITTDNMKAHKVRAIYFKPLPPAVNPTTVPASAFSERRQIPTPISVDPSTLPPAHIEASRCYPGA